MRITATQANPAPRASANAGSPTTASPMSGRMTRANSATSAVADGRECHEGAQQQVAEEHREHCHLDGQEDGSLASP
jgi:hypothetical protein